MQDQSDSHKTEARQRLLHDLRTTPPPQRRYFLMQAAAGLVAATSGAAGATAATTDAGVQITDLKATILRADNKDWTTLVELRTNQGLTGYGQTLFASRPRCWPACWRTC